METTREPREQTNSDLGRTVGLIAQNCEELLAALTSGTPSDQADRLATLLMHMGIGRRELLLKLQDILRENPTAMTENVRKLWLEEK